MLCLFQHQPLVLMVMGQETTSCIESEASHKQVIDIALSCLFVLKSLQQIENMMDHGSISILNLIWQLQMQHNFVFYLSAI